MLQNRGKLGRAWLAAVIMLWVAGLLGTAACAPQSPTVEPSANVFSNWETDDNPKDGVAEYFEWCAYLKELAACNTTKSLQKHWIKVDPATRFDPADGINTNEYAAGWLLSKWLGGNYAPISGEEELLRRLLITNGDPASNNEAADKAVFLTRWEKYLTTVGTPKPAGPQPSPS